MDESNISALIYGTVNPGLLRENTIDGFEIFLSDCESVLEAKEKLKEQKIYVDRTITAVTDSNWENIVNGVCNVVKMEQAYSKTVSRVTELRASVDRSKHMLTSLTRNISQLKLEQYEYKYALEMIEKIKECEDLYILILNGNIVEEDFKMMTTKISKAYKELNNANYEKSLLKKESKNNLKKAANLLIKKIDDELSRLLYSPVSSLVRNYATTDNSSNRINSDSDISNENFGESNFDAEEKSHCKKIRMLSSYIYELLICTNDNNDSMKSHDKFSELKAAVNAQANFNSLFLNILYKYDAKSIEDILRQYDKTAAYKVHDNFYYFVQDLMKLCEIYMERFWHFYVGGSLRYFHIADNDATDDDINISNCRNFIDSSSINISGANNTLIFLWYTVQTDLISILRRHFEEEVVYVDNANIRSSFQDNMNNFDVPDAIVSRTIDNWFIDNDGSEMSFYVHERQGISVEPPPYTNTEDKTRTSVPFDQLFVCPPTPYNAVEIFTLVNRIAKKIDEFVHSSMKKTSTTPSRKKRNSRTNMDLPSYQRTDSSIETLVPFIQCSRDFLFNCIKTDIIKAVVAICDSPSAVDRLQVASENNTNMIVLSSTKDMIKMIENWINRFCLIPNQAVNNKEEDNVRHDQSNFSNVRTKPFNGDHIDELLLEEVVKSVDFGIERYLKWCARMFLNDWNETISKKRIAKYNNTIFLRETGCELDMEKFLYWLLDHIVDDGCNDVTQRDENDEYERYNNELIQLSKKLDNYQEVKDDTVKKNNTNDENNVKLTTRTLSLIEIYLMEDQYFNNIKYDRSPDDSDHDLVKEANTGTRASNENRNRNFNFSNNDNNNNYLELNEKNLIPIMDGLDTIACFHTSLKYIRSKLKDPILHTITKHMKVVDDDIKSNNGHNYTNLLPSMKKINLYLNECLFILRTNLRVRCYWHLDNIINDFYSSSNKDIAKVADDDYNTVYYAMKDNTNKSNGKIFDDNGVDSTSSAMFPSIWKLCDDIYSFNEHVLPLLQHGDDNKSCHFVLGGLGTLIGTTILNKQVHLIYKICGEDLMNRKGTFKRRKHDKQKRHIIWKQVKESLRVLKRSFFDNKMLSRQHKHSQISVIDEIKSQLLHADKVLDVIALKLDRKILERIMETDLQYNYYDKKILNALVL